MSERCTDSKHHVKPGRNYCDCKALFVLKDRVGYEMTIQIVDPVQRDALQKMGKTT